MTREELADLAPEDLLALCCYGEARGEPVEGQIAQMWAIRNRVTDPKKRFGNDYAGVILRPKQFSCLNPDDPATPRNEEDPNLDHLLALAARIEDSLALLEQPFTQIHCLARGIVIRDIQDNTGGANHYHATKISPDWAFGKEPTVTIGHHAFYRL